MRRLLPAAVVLVLLAATSASASGQRTDAVDLAAHVDARIGTAPVGFVFPGAAVPFGMVQNSPDTEGPVSYGGYSATDALIRGFSLVHISGPGVFKGGDVPLMPTTGPVTTTSPHLYGSPWERATEQAEAGAYAVQLVEGPRVELTASERVGWQRYSFPPGSGQANVLLDVSRSARDNQSPNPWGSNPAELTIDVEAQEVRGWVRGRYPVHFVARFDAPFTSTGTWQQRTLQAGSTEAAGSGVGGWVSFDATAGATITARIGISFVDVEGARRNLEAEGEGRTFDEVEAAARAAWREALGRVRVQGGTVADRTAFATALYRSLLHPNVFTDADGRYRGMDDAVHRAEGRTHYANFASWDTYKSHNQLIATLFPARASEMVRSQLDNARRQGRIPRFGEHSIDAGHMSGDPALPMLVDNLCRGVLADWDADDLEELYRYATELSTVHRPPSIRELGWLPDRPGTTLEHGVADFALVLFADALGRDDDVERWTADALRYRHVLDPETGWVRPRAADGSWHTPFDPTEETGFQEGNSWQYSWLAPHDARGIYDRMGGDEVAIERLDELFAYELASRVPLVAAEVHKQLNVFGLVYRTPTYAPGNEHDLQVPWMYPFARQPWKTQAVHRHLQGLFRPTLDGLPGNDDLGGLSSWFVWSALGLGPVTPGAPFLVIGSPVFEHVELVPDDGGPTLTIEAPGASLLTKHVVGATLGDEPLDRAWATHAELVGGTLRLEMASSPSASWATAAEAVPPSVSDSPLAAFGCDPGR
jgi:predicted alpha-1,2-mannosidase